jgi:CheY-like chemotaxis protein
MVELHCAPLDLRVAIEAALEQIKPLIEERQHALVVEQARRMPVDGDSKRLTQVIANVLSNAAKYTDRGGKIQLIARSENDHAVVRILDSGIGIPLGQLDKVFEMFTQVPEHRARSGGGGLGIGLAISRRLIELHGGSMSASSEGLGRGSEFLIRLPLGASARRSAASLRQRNPAAHKRQRVLIIEDNVDVAKALRVLVTSIGHDVQTAPDGPSGIALLETFTPDVLLLDIGLPGMSGYEVARRVRSLPCGEKILIVAVTGWGQESDRKHARQAGFDHHLTKPVRLEELERALHSVRAAAPDVAMASVDRRA